MSAGAMNPVARGWRQLRIILEMIKFEHTVFALPFALMAALLAAADLPHRLPPVRTLIWILVAMVGAAYIARAREEPTDARRIP